MTTAQAEIILVNAQVMHQLHNGTLYLESSRAVTNLYTYCIVWCNI